MSSTSAPVQLTFGLPLRTALRRGDFFVSPANAVALQHIEQWPRWRGGKLVLCGPRGAGKTHLAHVWARCSGASFVAASDVAQSDVPVLASAPLVVEDVPAIAADPQAQRAVLHLHNLSLAEGHALLFTGTGQPPHWGIGLPDLASRLSGALCVHLQPPDDALLCALLAKLFADRQLVPTAETIPYLVRHMERSFMAGQRIVAQLDRASMAQGRPITRRLAAQVLKEA
ncbi:MAG: chromosomal replication initiator DnaA [Rhodobacteraceae bacterium]|nr:chromosomal replication initiator DnaA [Paracoccaceae bacterium]